MKTFKQFLEESESSSQSLYDWVSYHVGAIGDPLDARHEEGFELGNQVILKNGELCITRDPQFSIFQYNLENCGSLVMHVNQCTLPSMS